MPAPTSPRIGAANRRPLAARFDSESDKNQQHIADASDTPDKNDQVLGCI
jgi:hypothetical protein